MGFYVRCTQSYALGVTACGYDIHIGTGEDVYELTQVKGYLLENNAKIDASELIFFENEFKKYMISDPLGRYCSLAIDTLKLIKDNNNKVIKKIDCFIESKASICSYATKILPKGILRFADFNSLRTSYEELTTVKTDQVKTIPLTIHYFLYNYANIDGATMPYIGDIDSQTINLYIAPAEAAGDIFDDHLD